MSEENIQTNSIQMNTTYIHNLDNFTFGNISKEQLINIFKDGRAFSHVIEPWLSVNYPLIHIKGCKNHDHIDIHNTKYEQKTFSK